MLPNVFQPIRKKSNFLMTNIRTFIFLDLETTGLPQFENNKTKITELSLVAVQEGHISLGVIPRVQNKLNLCFNPWKLISPESEQITGLSNCMLESMSPFTSKTVDCINLFIEHNPRPICFVAHNGNRFDYPILQASIKNTNAALIDDIYCIDSLEMFRNLELNDTTTKTKIESETIPTNSTESFMFQDNFDDILCRAVDEYEQSVEKALKVQKINETTPKRPIENPSQISISPSSQQNEITSKKVKVTSIRRQINYGISFKLVDVYERLTKCKAEGAHMADNDVMMLLMCAATLGDRFVSWANQNARKFNEISPMTPGKKIV